eukprot:2483098-Prymnesium_polylepis.2
MAAEPPASRSPATTSCSPSVTLTLNGEASAAAWCNRHQRTDGEATAAPDALDEPADAPWAPGAVGTPGAADAAWRGGCRARASDWRLCHL